MTKTAQSACKDALFKHTKGKFKAGPIIVDALRRGVIKMQEMGINGFMQATSDAQHEFQDPV